MAAALPILVMACVFALYIHARARESGHQISKRTRRAVARARAKPGGSDAWAALSAEWAARTQALKGPEEPEVLSIEPVDEDAVAEGAATPDSDAGPALERIRAQLTGEHREPGAGPPKLQLGPDPSVPPPLPIVLGVPGAGPEGSTEDREPELSPPLPAPPAVDDSHRRVASPVVRAPIAAPTRPLDADRRGTGDAELFERLEHVLESHAAQPPPSEVRYSISSSLVRPAARLFSAVRGALAGPGRDGDRLLIERARELPMFGIGPLGRGQLGSEELEEAVVKLRHAAPALQSGVLGAAARLALALDAGPRGRVLAAVLTRLQPPSDDAEAEASGDRD